MRIELRNEYNDVVVSGVLHLRFVNDFFKQTVDWVEGTTDKDKCAMYIVECLNGNDQLFLEDGKKDIVIPHGLLIKHFVSVIDGD